MNGMASAGLAMPWNRMQQEDTQNGSRYGKTRVFTAFLP